MSLALILSEGVGQGPVRVTEVTRTWRLVSCYARVPCTPTYSPLDKSQAPSHHDSGRVTRTQALAASQQNVWAKGTLTAIYPGVPALGCRLWRRFLQQNLRVRNCLGITVASTREAARALHLQPFRHSACVLSHFSRVPLFVTLWTVAHQAPLSMGLSRQEY